jgi:hypothetical protein
MQLAPQSPRPVSSVNWLVTAAVYGAALAAIAAFALFGVDETRALLLG